MHESVATGRVSHATTGSTNSSGTASNHWMTATSRYRDHQTHHCPHRLIHEIVAPFTLKTQNSSGIHVQVELQDGWTRSWGPVSLLSTHEDETEHLWGVQHCHSRSSGARTRCIKEVVNRTRCTPHVVWPKIILNMRAQGRKGSS